MLTRSRSASDRRTNANGASQPLYEICSMSLPAESAHRPYFPLTLDVHDNIFGGCTNTLQRIMGGTVVFFV